MSSSRPSKIGPRQNIAFPQHVIDHVEEIHHTTGSTRYDIWRDAISTGLDTLEANPPAYIPHANGRPVGPKRDFTLPPETVKRVKRIAKARAANMADIYRFAVDLAFTKDAA